MNFIFISATFQSCVYFSFKASFRMIAAIIFKKKETTGLNINKKAIVFKFERKKYSLDKKI
jgi:hypothetical protein